MIVNDLEIPVFEKYLLLPVMKEWLKSQPGVESCFMSGSGSTMVAIMDPREPPLTTEPLRADFQERFGSTCWMAETAFDPARGGA